MTYQEKVIAEKFNSVLRQNLSDDHYGDPRVAKFITHYMISKDKTQAAREAGITKADGIYLYNQPDIYKCIEALLSSEVVKFGYNAAEVVERTKEIAFYDLIDCMNPDGTYRKSLNDIPAETRRAIKEITFKNTYAPDFNGVPQYSGEIINIKFHDKVKSLEMVSREKDVFKKSSIVTHDIGTNARSYLLQSAERAIEAVKELGLSHTPVIDVTPVKAAPESIQFAEPPGVK